MNNQRLKLLIILIIIFLPLQGSFAQDVDTQNNIKTTNNTDVYTVKNTETTTEDTSGNTSGLTNQSNIDDSGLFENSNMNDQTNKTDTKTKSDVKNNKKENLLNSNNLTLTPKDKINSNKVPLISNTGIKLPPVVSRLLKKHHLDFTTLLAILGLFGTFLGLFSTWTIYLLNKKNNDPFFIDRKNSAIKYIEAIDKIRESINKNSIRKLDALLDCMLSMSLSSSESEELINLISVYIKYTVLISNVPLLDIHDRYKKHIKPNRADIFNSFIALYKLVEVEGKFYSETCGLMDYKSLESMNFFTEDSAYKWKQKIITLLSIDEKASDIKKIIFKDLKK